MDTSLKANLDLVNEALVEKFQLEDFKNFPSDKKNQSVLKKMFLPAHHIHINTDSVRPFKKLPLNVLQKREKQMDSYNMKIKKHNLLEAAQVEYKPDPDKLRRKMVISMANNIKFNQGDSIFSTTNKLTTKNNETNNNTRLPSLKELFNPQTPDTTNLAASEITSESWKERSQTKNKSIKKTEKSKGLETDMSFNFKYNTSQHLIDLVQKGKDQDEILFKALQLKQNTRRNPYADQPDPVNLKKPVKKQARQPLDREYAVDKRFCCGALQNPEFVDMYHKRWSIAKHLLSPIFKDDSDKFLTGENLDSLSTLSERERIKVNDIVDRNMPFLAKLAKDELLERRKRKKSTEQLQVLLDNTNETNQTPPPHLDDDWTYDISKNLTSGLESPKFIDSTEHLFMRDQQPDSRNTKPGSYMLRSNELKTYNTHNTQDSDLDPLVHKNSLHISQLALAQAAKLRNNINRKCTKLTKSVERFNHQASYSGLKQKRLDPLHLRSSDEVASVQGGTGPASSNGAVTSAKSSARKAIELTSRDGSPRAEIFTEMSDQLDLIWHLFINNNF